jgi:hypothetical protein
MLNWRFIGCRLLALLAWLAASAWFVVAYAATWGFVPIAMGYWSMVALPVAGLTSMWLNRVRQRESSRVERWTMIAWLFLLLMLVPLIVAGDHPLWDHPSVEALVMSAFGVYLVFPVVVTGWALREIIRASSGMPRSGPTKS